MVKPREGLATITCTIFISIVRGDFIFNEIESRIRIRRIDENSSKRKDLVSASRIDILYTRVYSRYNTNYWLSDRPESRGMLENAVLRAI